MNKSGIPAEQVLGDFQDYLRGLLDGARRAQTVPEMHECYEPLFQMFALGDIMGGAFVAQQTTFAIRYPDNVDAGPECTAILAVALGFKTQNGFLGRQQSLEFARGCGRNEGLLL